MTKSAKWAVGIVVFVGFIAGLWYVIFGLTGMLWWGSETTTTASLDPAEPPQIPLSDLSSLDIDRALREMEESQIKAPVGLSDDPRLTTVDCKCGCGIVLMDCDCEVALKQIEEVRTTKGKTER